MEVVSVNPQEHYVAGDWYMKILFLDDNEERHRRFLKNRIGQSITTAYSYDEVVQLLDREVFDIAYLDHDLSIEAQEGKQLEDEKTGTDVAKYIASMEPAKRPKQVVIHSFNRYGALRMKEILAEVNISVVCQPFNG